MELNHIGMVRGDEMSKKGLRLVVDGAGLNNAIHGVKKKLKRIERNIRRAEIKRMHELVFKYGYIRDMLMADLRVKEIDGRLVFPNVYVEMDKLEPDEMEALNSWANVLSGRSPFPPLHHRMVGEMGKNGKTVEELVSEEAYRIAQNLEERTLRDLKKYINMTEEEREKMAWHYGLSDEAKKRARELGIL